MHAVRVSPNFSNFTHQIMNSIRITVTVPRTISKRLKFERNFETKGYVVVAIMRHISRNMHPIALLFLCELELN